MNPYAYLPLIASFFALFLSVFIISNRITGLNITFVLLCIATIVWQLTWVVLFNVTDPSIASFLVKIGYSGIIFLPMTFYHFSVLFTEKKSEYKIVIESYIFCFILLVLLWFSPYYISGYYTFFWGYYPKANFMHPFYLLFLFFLVYRCYYLFTSQIRLKETKPFKKDQLKYLNAALLVYTIAASDFIVNYGVQFYPVGCIFVLLSLSIIAFTITKTRLMDISVVISRAVAYGLIGAFYFLIYAGIVFLCNYFNLNPIIQTLLGGVALIFTGLTFNRLRIAAQTTADKTFIKGWYNYREVQRKISDEFRRVYGKEETIRVVFENLDNSLDVSNVKILLPNGEEYSEWDIGTDNFKGNGLNISKTDPFIEKLKESKDIVSKDEYSKMPKGFILAIPCFSEVEMEMIILLGTKRSEDSYNDQDYDLLRTIRDEVSDILVRIKPYEEVKKEFESTQLKLIETERQLERSQRLATVGTLTAGVTHEIRNPLTGIRAKTEMIDDEPRDISYLTNYKNIIVEQIERIESIINRMLKLSKQKEKVRVDVDLNQAIESTLSMMTISKVKLVQQLNQIQPVKGDPEEMVQIFSNLIQNGLNAMPNGGTLTITTYVEENYVYCKISDSGAGIPKENLDRIFDAFFSTKHEGTGLGLSIVYRIVREHNGNIAVESEVGKGTTFTLRFPITEPNRSGSGMR